jgi:hypothetical protein
MLKFKNTELHGETAMKYEPLHNALQSTKIEQKMRCESFSHINVYLC